MRIISNDRNAFPFMEYGSFKLPYKGRARVYVEHENKIEVVKNIMIDMDGYEVEWYYPEGLIAVYNDKIDSIYNGKFNEIDMGEVLDKCWAVGIRCFVVIEDDEDSYDY